MRTPLRFLLFLLLSAWAAATGAQSTATLRALGVVEPYIGPDETGLVINADDPLSVQIGEYYRERRGIPEHNVVRVHVPGTAGALPVAEFEKLKHQIDQALGPEVQVLALAWLKPYAVDCMSITGALAFGYQAEWCRHTCAPTRPSPYFDSASRRPYADFGMRPAMLLAAQDFEQAKALIDRGVAADRSHPRASAYFMDTSDKARNVRAALYPQLQRLRQPLLAIRVIKADALEDKTDVMVYVSGVARVDKLDTLRFVPGALADHLTSAGGQMPDSTQMSSLRWLEAGATASYGTVSEPCNHPQKFPHPAVLLKHYLSGSSAIEAYWKSVLWPGQGVFIGEPLAAPYRR